VVLSKAFGNPINRGIAILVVLIFVEPRGNTFESVEDMLLKNPAT
jgi:hypothetical protein